MLSQSRLEAHNATQQSEGEKDEVAVNTTHPTEIRNDHTGKNTGHQDKRLRQIYWPHLLEYDMGKAANRKRDRNQVAIAHTTPQIQGSKMTHIDNLQTQMNASSEYLDFDTDNEWLDVEVTDRDIALVEGILVAIIRNDVAMVDKFVTLLPTSNLSLDTVSFRDTGTDQVYSMLGLAKSLGANRVAAYLMSSGLSKDFIDDEGTLH